jgi:aromatic ring hydroxylase
MSTEAKPVFGAARSAPFTSQEFLESLRDGREIWIYGERVNVPQHQPHAGALV